jgi:hypothetical protein
MVQAEKDLHAVKENIDRRIADLLDLLRRFDSLELIARYARHNLVVPVDTPVDDSRSESRVEYLISLATAQSPAADAAYPGPNEIQRCFDLVDSIFISVSLYHGIEKARRGDPSDPRIELSAELQINALHVRGDGYYHHMRKRFEDVIGSHDYFFRGHVGFGIREFHRFIDSVEEQFNARLQEDQYTSVRPLQELMGRIAREFQLPLKQITTETADPTRIAAIRQKYGEQIRAAKDQFDRASPADLFRIEPKSDCESKLLSEFSCSFGENSGFLDKLRGYKGWPLNPSVFSAKPIVSARGAFYIFHLQFLGRSAYRLFDEIARRHDQNYRTQRYLKSRDNYLESESVALVAKALPGSVVHRNLHYDWSNGAHTGKGEVDGLIIFDDNCLIIEAKAHGLSAAARRGAPSFVEDVALSIGDSYRQAVRLSQELELRGSVQLFDGSGRFVTELNRCDFERVFCISATFESLPIVATKLPSVRDLGLLPGRDWPWSVCLDDLRVIVEILNRPSLFLHYLVRRVRVNDFRKVSARDELDYLMNYVYQGLFFDTDPNYEKFDELVLADHTRALTEYYQRLQGFRNSGKKPRPQLGGRVKQFLDLLERSRPHHFTSATLALLDYDAKTRDEVLGALPAQLKRFRETGRTIFAAACCKDDAAALFTCIVPPANDAVAWAEERCRRDLLPKYNLSHGVLVVMKTPLAAGGVEVRIVHR